MSGVTSWIEGDSIDRCEDAWGRVVRLVYGQRQGYSASVGCWPKPLDGLQQVGTTASV